MDTYTLQSRLKMTHPIKIYFSKMRIREWIEQYGITHVHVNNSGGKDSAVLAHLVQQTVKEYFPGQRIKEVMVNTRIENPHNMRRILKYRREYKTLYIIYPNMSPEEVWNKYGFPVGTKSVAAAIYRYRLNPTKNQWRLTNSRAKGYIPKCWRFLLNSDIKVSDYCCEKLKKDVLKKWAKKNKSHPFIGNIVEESQTRKNLYLKRGCNAYDAKEPQSWPIAFWTKKDIDRYVRENNVEISKAYETEERTGCMVCAFGIKYDLNRFVRLKQYYPKWYKRAMQAGFDKVLKILEIGLKLPPGRLGGSAKTWDGYCPKCNEIWKSYKHDGAEDICPKCGNKEVE